MGRKDMTSHRNTTPLSSPDAVKGIVLPNKLGKLRQNMCVNV